MATPTILHAYFRSSCSWRVRAALRWKGIPFEERPVDIIKEQHQLTDEYRAINPAQKVPALTIDGVTLVESMAILRYLEDTRPLPTLTPSTPLLRARMWEICETIASGIQPLQNVGLLRQLAYEKQYEEFTRSSTERGLETLEKLLEKSAGRFCVEDQLTMADLCFVPQIYNATTRLRLEIGKYETVSKVYNNLLKEALFEETHPKNINPKK